MAKKLTYLIILLLLASFALYFKKDLKSVYDKYFFYSPCNTPIEYSIGSIDPRFQISKKQLIADSKTAASIWNKTEDKNLLAYNTNAFLTINLVYDSRQQLNSKIGDLNNNLNQQKNVLDPEVRKYKEQSTQLKVEIDSLNSQIEYWNSKGGAPKDVYDKLIQQQESFQTQAKALNSKAEKLGQETANYNADASKLNQTINSYEQALQYKPEEGLYVQDGSSKTISIYIYNSKNEFIHTLAHEMGHALGLKHVTDPNSIMYAQTNSILKPSPQDVAELSDICKTESIASIAFKKAKLLISQFQLR